MKLKSILFIALISVLAAGCSHGLSGTYLPKGGGIGSGVVMSKLTFVSGDTVDISMMEQTVHASYKVDGKQVTITVNGEGQIFTINDDGCLDGGSMFGTFCKS